MLGATPREGGLNIALWASHASRVELCLYDRSGALEVGRLDMPEPHGPEPHGGVWAAFLTDSTLAELGFGPGGVELSYGFRVHGPYSPREGHRHNPAKLMLDPWAKALSGQFRWGPEHYGYTLGGDPDGPPDTRDSAPTAWKAQVVDPARLLAGGKAPALTGRPLIYELHVKGFTVRLQGLSEAERGRFAGLATPQALRYLKALGVSHLELMPPVAFQPDHRLVDQGLTNYWGYNPLAYFCPHVGYAAGDPIAEFQALTEAAHAAGLGVLIDVVYNHTCEGDHRGPTLSWRGIDNAGYYRLRQGSPDRYDDVTGCGATLDADSPLVQRLVLESLRHWVDAYGVDGFRFDLAPTLGLHRNGQFNREHPLLRAITTDPVLADRWLIAEAWDAAGGFHVGGFPARFSEWNGPARDTIRHFWRGDDGFSGQLATRIAGSQDLFSATTRVSRASITYVACHDGFPLADLTRYVHKHNLANGEANRDGSDHNISHNHGVEGETRDPDILAARERTARNLLGTALLSHGTPMLLAGDEFLRTQGGNNNAYAQDNSTSWIDWGLAETPAGARMLRFVQRLIALATTHPVFAASAFPQAEADVPGEEAEVPLLDWFNPHGEPMRAPDWQLPWGRCFSALMRPSARVAAGDPRELLVVLNADRGPVRVRLPGLAHQRWSSVLDTFAPDSPPGAQVAAAGEDIEIFNRTLWVFESTPPARAGLRTTTNRGNLGHAY